MFSLAALAVSPTAQAQELGEQRQGNIVEYFGKEKIEDISEGKLVHVFKKGLVLARPGAFGIAQSESTPIDEVMARFLFNRPTGINTDHVFDVDYSGRPIKWEEIEVDDKSTFQDRRLRSGVLYLSYVADADQTVLLDASGHSSLLVNGMPHEGEHFDFGWNLVPLHLKRGKHEFVLQGGRFGRMRARLVEPDPPVRFTRRDTTLPDIRREDGEELLGAIRVINAKDAEILGARIECRRGADVATSAVPRIAPRIVRKVPFLIPAMSTLNDEAKQVEFEIELFNRAGDSLAKEPIKLNVRSKHEHHRRTFISEIDGSVQYYSVAPSSDPNLENPAMFLSVHGASVEATNQAAAYQQKDWGHLVAPTNRRPFGFAWEDWGRLDAMEVLTDAERVYKTDRRRTYLTGHSMGGHGTWYLGATYPDRWAAIAPCAGYPDLLDYRSGFMSRIHEMPEQMRRRFGITDAMINRMKTLMESKSVFDEIVNRGGSPSRTLTLISNYAQYGIYVLHGENDTVVPTAIARDMRRRLGEFHSDFTYYEYPNGSHWYGNHSVDWPPIFDFFKARSIKPPHDTEEFSFSTASPGVSARSHFVTIVQQEVPFKVSSVHFERTDDLVRIETSNVRALTVDVDEMGLKSEQKLEVDGQAIEVAPSSKVIHLLRGDTEWTKTESAPAAKEKGPHRNGGFKDAFRNRLVLVYGTQGTDFENEWYFNRARCDAEKFWYRANGNVELVSDTHFADGEYADRNVVLYGNRDNNSVWDLLLKDCPLQVSDGSVTMEDTSLSGPGWGAYFIYRRQDSNVASVGVITASGVAGMKAAYANHYLVNATCFPDVMIFDQHFLSRGIQSLKCAGFWGNSWDVNTGDFVWR